MPSITKNPKIENNPILNVIFDLIKNSKTKGNYSMDNKNKRNQPIFFIYQLLYKLFKTNQSILSSFIGNRIISTLFRKLIEENKEIRNLIYDILIFAIKNTKNFCKELFDFKEEDKEGEYDFIDKELLSTSIDKDIIDCLFHEKKELLIILLIILEHNNESFMNNFNQHIA